MEYKKDDLDVINEFFSPAGFDKYCQSINSLKTYERNHSSDYWISRGASQMDNTSAAGPDSSDSRPGYIDFIEQKCRGKDVLELCAGSGRISAFIDPVANTYAGIERSQTMIDRINPTIREKVICNDVAKNFPFQDGTFDIVIVVLSMTSIFYHVEFVYQESMRVLKSGGQFIIVENYKTVEFEKR